MVCPKAIPAGWRGSDQHSDARGGTGFPGVSRGHGYLTGYFLPPSSVTVEVRPQKEGLPHRLSLGKLRYLWHGVSTHLGKCSCLNSHESFKINYNNIITERKESWEKLRFSSSFYFECCLRINRKKPLKKKNKQNDTIFRVVSLLQFPTWQSKTILLLIGDRV